ncbi:MAG TPA: hypothetical protein VN732_07215 [Solirubrobacterales bacterium]|nr:hypothetical protein [Solirubrobacterales bacterium]
MAESNGNGTNVGRVEQVTGVVIDAVFPDQLPEIFSAVTIETSGGDGDGESAVLVCEVQQHLGDDRVRAVAMDATDGIERGAAVTDTGGPITVPVGDATPAASSTCSASRSTTVPSWRTASAGRSTARPRRPPT